MGSREPFKGIEIKVGIVVVLVLVVFCGSLYYVAYKKELFSEKVYYTLRAKSGQDLSRGMPVKFSGFQIGSVKDLFLEADGTMRIKMAILKKYSKWIREDSQFTLAREGMIGPVVLMLTPGKGKVARPGSSFLLKRQKGIEEVVEEVKPVLREISATITELHKLLVNINDPEGRVNRILANVQDATASLNSGDGVLRYVLHDSDSREKLKESLEKLSLLGERLNSVAENINSTVDDIKDTVGSIKETSGEVKTDALELKSLIGEVREELIPALQNIRKTSEGLPLVKRKLDYTLELSKDLIIKLHNTWPLSREEKKEKRPALPAP